MRYEVEVADETIATKTTTREKLLSLTIRRKSNDQHIITNRQHIATNKYMGIHILISFWWYNRQTFILRRFIISYDSIRCCDRPHSSKFVQFFFTFGQKYLSHVSYYAVIFSFKIFVGWCIVTLLISNRIKRSVYIFYYSFFGHLCRIVTSAK